MSQADRGWAVLKTLLFGIVIGFFVVYYLPWTLAIRGYEVSYEGAGALRWLAIVPLVAGAIIALRCAFAFAWMGLGTPVPFDPPRTLIVSGFYRYVRNPMFLGVCLLLLGEIALWGSLAAGLGYVAVFAAAVVLLILLHEEPSLRAKFGADYQEYCRNVPRFLPRLTPWKKTGGNGRLTST
jgi:protein-S-isoprenylcysteine O-methyltransferase Ste14